MKEYPAKCMDCHVELEIEDQECDGEYTYFDLSCPKCGLLYGVNIPTA